MNKWQKYFAFILTIVLVIDLRVLLVIANNLISLAAVAVLLPLLPVGKTKRLSSSLRLWWWHSAVGITYLHLCRENYFWQGNIMMLKNSRKEKVRTLRRREKDKEKTKKEELCHFLLSLVLKKCICNKSSEKLLFSSSLIPV